MRISDWSSDVCSSDLAAVADNEFLVEDVAIVVRPGVDAGAQQSSKEIAVLFHGAADGEGVGGRPLLTQVVLFQHQADAHPALARPHQRLGDRPGFDFLHGDVESLFRLVDEADDGRSEAHTSELQSLMRTSY